MDVGIFLLASDQMRLHTFHSSSYPCLNQILLCVRYLRKLSKRKNYGLGWWFLKSLSRVSWAHHLGAEARRIWSWKGRRAETAHCMPTKKQKMGVALHPSSCARSHPGPQPVGWTCPEYAFLNMTGLSIKTDDHREMIVLSRDRNVLPKVSSAVLRCIFLELLVLSLPDAATL